MNSREIYKTAREAEKNELVTTLTKFGTPINGGGFIYKFMPYTTDASGMILDDIDIRDYDIPSIYVEDERWDGVALERKDVVAVLITKDNRLRYLVCDDEGFVEGDTLDFSQYGEISDLASEIEHRETNK